MTVIFIFYNHIVEESLAAEGKLTAKQLLNSRFKYFSQGAAIGCKSFIESQFNQHREIFGPTRSTKAKPILQTSPQKEKSPKNTSHPTIKKTPQEIPSPSDFELYSLLGTSQTPPHPIQNQQQE